MNNLFPPHRDIHETYDLKGSTYGREFPEEKVKENSKVTLKDLNWVHRGRRFELGPEKRALFAEQLRRDMEFLKKMKVMDYSLLIGLHNMERGNRDNIRENQLTVFHVSCVVRPFVLSLTLASTARRQRTHPSKALIGERWCRRFSCPESHPPIGPQSSRVGNAAAAEL